MVKINIEGKINEIQELDGTDQGPDTSAQPIQIPHLQQSIGGNRRSEIIHINGIGEQKKRKNAIDDEKKKASFFPDQAEKRRKDYEKAGINNDSILGKRDAVQKNK
jgi:hypothetical protein